MTEKNLKSLGKTELLSLLRDQELDEYNSMLSLGSSGVIGYLEIPAISVRLPMYLGTSEAAFQIGTGHIEGTSLPAGGESTHSVFSGHRGLPSAGLLSDLDMMVPGDRFTVTVLDELLTYEVDQILIVEPDDMQPLAPVDAVMMILLLLICLLIKYRKQTGRS